MPQNKLQVIPKTVYIFEFSGSENLFNCIARLSRNQITAKIKSDLYAIDKKYRLILYATRLQKGVLSLSREFTDKVYKDINSLNETKEYGKIITQGNATEKIGKVL